MRLAWIPRSAKCPHHPFVISLFVLPLLLQAFYIATFLHSSASDTLVCVRLHRRDVRHPRLVQLIVGVCAGGWEW